MKTAKKTAALFLAVIIAFVAAACAKDAPSDSAVLTFGEHSVGKDEYRFLYATYKARYLTAYNEARSSGEDTDERFDSLIRDAVRMYLVAGALFDDARLELSGDALAGIDEHIEDLVAERFDGDRAKFEKSLGEYGIGVEDFRTVLQNTEKIARLFDHYFGSNGVRALTDDERAKYYRENYVRFAQINVNDRYAYVERDGAYVQNEDGSYQTRDLTEAERAEKAKIAAAIDEALAAGATVESLYSEYSENTDYPGGYYFSRLNEEAYDGDIVEAAFALAVGERTKLSTKHGTFWIERLALPEHGWTLNGAADFFGDFDDALKNSLFDELLKSYFGEIAEDEQKLAAFDLKSIEPNHYLY